MARRPAWRRLVPALAHHPDQRAGRPARRAFAEALAKLIQQAIFQRRPQLGDALLGRRASRLEQQGDLLLGRFHGPHVFGGGQVARFGVKRVAHAL
jgi:hypothetical protein